MGDKMSSLLYIFSKNPEEQKFGRFAIENGKMK
jgi:hypothetical protein